jgi:hypothetical protein
MSGAAYALGKTWYCNDFINLPPSVLLNSDAHRARWVDLM